jgi:hypothetical protein
MESGGLKLAHGMEESLDSVVAPDSDEVAAEDVVSDLEEVAAEDVGPDSEEVAAEDVMPDCMPPNSQVIPCNRCCTVHNINDLESCRLAHRLASQCHHCGLVHSDYDLAAWIHGLDEFDCEICIPDVDKLQMHGNTILVLEHVQKNLDDIWKKEAKMEQ